MNVHQIPNVLVVDDSADSRFLLRAFFVKSNCTVDWTSNGIEALSKLRKMRDLPQLILLDLNMPQMDGYEFRSRQLADPTLREIPLVVMSAEDDVEKIRSAIHPNCILLKPINLARLRILAREFLRGSSDFPPLVA